MSNKYNINEYIDLYIDDALSAMKNLQDKSIDVIITSPPYYKQRDYNSPLQWGNEDSLKLYMAKMEEWCIECFRVLKDSGTIFLNIGDKYNKKGLMLIPERIAIMFCDNNWCLRNNIVWYKPNHMPSSAKDRLCNTYENVFFFVKENNKYYSTEYYSNIDNIRIKTNLEISDTNTKWPPTIEIDEYDNKWRDVIEKYNEDKLKKYNGKYKAIVPFENPNPNSNLNPKPNQKINIGSSPGARSFKGISYSLQRKTKIYKDEGKKINEFIIKYYKKSKLTLEDIDNAFDTKNTASHWMRKDNGRSLPKPEHWYKLKTLLKIKETKYDDIMTQTHYVLQNAKNNPKGKNPGDMWSINNQKTSAKHYATYPLELPLKIIKGFCPPNGIVLDPFCGSGTTGLACKQEEIKCILIDCNEEFIEIIKTKCN